MSHKYEDWSKERLIAHVRKLENVIRNSRPEISPLDRNQVHNSPSTSTSTAVVTQSRSQKEFRFSDYPTRKIALRFTYDGTHYNGLEHQKDVTPLPTVEETLWEALVRTRLVDPDGNFDSHGWEKCGRTDRGVSAAGQVVSFWIRCKERGHPQREAASEGIIAAEVLSSSHLATQNSEDARLSSDAEPEHESELGLDDGLAAMSGWDEPPTNNTLSPPPKADIRFASENSNEFSYVTLLNNVLPPTLRVLSWSPVDPSFSARFNCRGRHYKYFFSSRGLNVDAMREGAQRLLGEHDWRNLCKVDPAKFRLEAEGEERWSFRRIVKVAEVNPVYHLLRSDAVDESGHDNKLYVFDLIGTAFLYNQVRHIMAILFLIGSGLEDPSVITALLNVDPSNPYPALTPDEAAPPVVTAKPIYQMADALPLVLWDCLYDKSDVTWVGEEPHGTASSAVDITASDVNGVYAELRSIHERSLVHSALHDHFLRAASRFHRGPREFLPLRSADNAHALPNGATLAVPLGGGAYRNTRIAGGKGFVRLLERKRLDEIEVTWQRWKNGKGTKRGKKADTVDQGTGDR